MPNWWIEDIIKTGLSAPLEIDLFFTIFASSVELETVGKQIVMGDMTSS